MKTLVLLMVISAVVCQQQSQPWNKPWKKTTDLRGAYKGMSRFPGGVKWELKLGTTTVLPRYESTTKAPGEHVVVSQYRPQRIPLLAAPPVLPALRPVLPPAPPTLPPLPSRGYLPIEDTPSRYYLPIV